MEKIREDSNRLRKIILPTVEKAVQEFIEDYTKARSIQTVMFHKEADKFTERIERTKMAIECDEAAISFIKSQMTEILKNKENIQCPKQILHRKLEKHRKYALKLSELLKFYEKRLGLSMKKLTDNTLWISFQHLNPINCGEFSATIKVENKTYSLLKCTPHLPTVGALIEELNATNNFSGFLKSLRASFKSVACDS